MIPFRLEPLTNQDRREFESGAPELDRYLREQAGQEQRRNVSRCFLALVTDTQEIAGYYTLAATSIVATDLPDDVTHRPPRYPQLPAVLIGRLAVASRHQGRKLGEGLLSDAFRRAHAADIASAIVLVDAMDDRAAAFYQRFGFSPLPTALRRLQLSLAAGLKLIRRP